MKDLFSYIERNKDVSFFKKDFTEVDVLLFSALSYLFLEPLFTLQKKYTLYELKKKIHRAKNKNLFLEDSSSLKLLDALAKTERYKEIEIANYVYITKENTQFGALTLRLPTSTYFVSFEGTDSKLAGWKEDAELSYHYPTEAQKEAGEYLKKVINQVKQPVFVCGHSKGGNLAIVGSMRTPLEERNKIKKIYSFDGPGLRENEFISPSYKNIKNRIKHYIPEQSIIGVFFLQENPTVIKSSSIGIGQHDLFTWEVMGDFLERGRQSHLSKELALSFTSWLKKYNLKERERIVESVFSIFQKVGIKDLMQLTDVKNKSLLEIWNTFEKLGEETKKVLHSIFLLIIKKE